MSDGADAGAKGKRVVVLGGGVAGLSAAHHLVRQGYEVHVVERRTEQQLGGKAYSYLFGAGDRQKEVRGLPGEHGFRFFPGFYSHVIDTMGEIPCACPRRPGAHHVCDHLVELDRADMIRAPAGETAKALRLPVPTEAHSPSMFDTVRAVSPMSSSLPRPRELYAAAAVLTRLLTACPQRWADEYENRTWWDISEAWRYSDRYQAWFARGLTRSFVATQAEEMSARTGGKVLLQLLYDVFVPRGRSSADRVLDGPTSEVWIQPWANDLVDHGVTFHCDTELTGIEIDASGQRPVVTGVTTVPPLPDLGEVDHYVLAVSCKALKNLLTLGLQPLLRADPAFVQLFELETRWMNGAFFYLTKDDLGGLDPSDLPTGHTILLDSEWALTLLDQRHVWAGSAGGLDGLGESIGSCMGDEGIVAVLSVDVSDWSSPGAEVPPAERPQRTDLGAAHEATGLPDEVWRQVREHFPTLAEATPRRAAVDPSVSMNLAALRRQLHPQAPVPGAAPTVVPPAGSTVAEGGTVIHDPVILRENADELLVNTAGSWPCRPTTATRLANLFLVGDYVATTTDFASMEAADESARRATNAMLAADGRAELAMLWPLRHPTRWWFVIPRTIARGLDRFVARPLKLRAPFRLPMLAFAVCALIDGCIGRIGRLFGRRIPGPTRISVRHDGSPKCPVDPGP